MGSGSFCSSIFRRFRLVADDTAMLAAMRPIQPPRRASCMKNLPCQPSLLNNQAGGFLFLAEALVWLIVVTSIAASFLAGGFFVASRKSPPENSR
jgi:hypothetical protein